MLGAVVKAGRQTFAGADIVNAVNDNDPADGPIPYQVRHRMAEHLDRCIAELAVITDPDLARIFARIYQEMKRITLQAETLKERRERLRPFETGIGQILASAKTTLAAAPVPVEPPSVLTILEGLERDGAGVLRRVRHERSMMLVKH